MTTKVADQMKAQAEAMRDVVDGYARGEADPGDGVLAQMVGDGQGRITQIVVRWLTPFGDTGSPYVEQTSLLLGLAALGRTLRSVIAQNRPRLAVVLPPSGDDESAMVPSTEGYALTVTQRYLIEMDRYVISATLTWTDTEAERAH